MAFLEQVRLSHPLYFFRHGQTDWNAEKRCQGLTDIPVNATGEEQARAYGRVLKGVIGPHLFNRKRLAFAFYSSPLSRASRTMALICHELGCPAASVEVDERLTEIDHGAWNGFTYDEIREKWPEDYAALQADKWATRRPDGESYEDRVEPLAQFLKELTGPAIVVGHGGTGRVLRAIIAGHPPSQVVHLPMTQDQFYAFESGQETIHRCNDDS